MRGSLPAWALAPSAGTTWPAAGPVDAPRRRPLSPPRSTHRAAGQGPVGARRGCGPHVPPRAALPAVGGRAVPAAGGRKCTATAAASSSASSGVLKLPALGNEPAPQLQAAPALISHARHRSHTYTTDLTRTPQRAGAAGPPLRASHPRHATLLLLLLLLLLRWCRRGRCWRGVQAVVADLHLLPLVRIVACGGGREGGRSLVSAGACGSKQAGVPGGSAGGSACMRHGCARECPGSRAQPSSWCSEGWRQLGTPAKRCARKAPQLMGR